MKITIITVVYNAASTIRQAVESVLNQDYPNVEYIVVDGGSNDGTLEILSEYPGKFRLISEKDDGLYDAINKGIRAATGEVIGLVHADDMLASNDVLTFVAKGFRSTGSDALYGDIQYFKGDNSDKIVRFWRSGIFKRKNIKTGWMPPHTGLFIKKSAYNKFGLYRLDLDIAADYELMFRYFYRYELRAAYIPKVICKMRLGGKSTKNIKNIIKANIQSCKSWRLNLFLKPLRKVLQLFVK